MRAVELLLLVAWPTPCLLSTSDAARHGHADSGLGDDYSDIMANYPSEPQPGLRKRRRFGRPSAVTLAAFLFLLQVVLLFESGAILWPGGRLELGPLHVWWEQRPERLLEFVFVLLGLLALVVALGLFWQRPWAWLLAMTLEGVNLAGALTAYAVGHPEYLNMLVGIVIVSILSQQETREAFTGRRVRRG